MPDKIRLTVDLSDEQGFRLRKNMEWGDQGHLFRKIVDQLNEFIERYGKVGIALFMSDELSLLDILSMREKEKQGGIKGPKTKHPRTQKGRGTGSDSQD